MFYKWAFYHQTVRLMSSSMLMAVAVVDGFANIAGTS
jgi:hypothetical protein